LRDRCVHEDGWEMISKRIAGRKDGRSSARTALRYGEGITPIRKTGQLLDKSHRTRFGNFGIIDDGVYVGRDAQEMARVIELAAIEMQATCDLNTRVGVDKKLAHFVVSFNQDKPSVAVLRDTEDSMLAVMKLDKNHFASFLHNDNGYWHLHLFASRIEKGKPHRGNPLWHDQINRDKVCREVEMRHGLRRDNGLHRIDGAGQIVEISRAERQSRRESKPAGISDRAKTTEIYSGEKSFQTWCAEIRIGDRLKHAKSWSELHAAAAAYRCAISPKGAGFVLSPIGEMGGIQLSKIGVKSIAAKFGAFQPAPLEHQVPPEIIFRPAPTQTNATRHYNKWREAKSVFNAIKFTHFSEQREAHNQIRKGLRARHQDELKKLRAATHGREKAVAVSVLKMEHAIAMGELNERLPRERQAKRIELAEKGPGTTFRDYLVNEAAKGDNEALGLARRYGVEGSTEVLRHRESDSLRSVAAVSGKEYRPTARLRFSFRVGRNGTVVFDLGEGRKLTDSAVAKQVQLNSAAANSPEAIATALSFAASKFGSTLTLSGSQEFQRLAVETAVRRGLRIDFTDPALQAYKQELAASIKQKMVAALPSPDLSHLSLNQISKGVQHVLTRSFDKGVPPDHIIRAEAIRRSLTARGDSGLHELPVGGVDAKRPNAGMLLSRPLQDSLGNKQAGQNPNLRRTGSGARSSGSAGKYASASSERGQLPLVTAPSILNQQVQRTAAPAVESEKPNPLTEHDQALAARIEEAIEKNDVSAIEKCLNEIGSPKREAAHSIAAAGTTSEQDLRTARYDALTDLSKRLVTALEVHRENGIDKPRGHEL
jgi:hypothetical protein